MPWLRPLGTWPCIQRLQGERSSHEVPASFTPLLGIYLFDITTLILGIVNFRLQYHQYIYWVQLWLPTKVRDSPALNFMLKVSSLWKVAGIILLCILYYYFIILLFNYYYFIIITSSIVTIGNIIFHITNDIFLLLSTIFNF